MAFTNTGTFNGNGTVNTDLINNGVIDVSGGVREINGTLSSTLSGGGAVTIETTGTLQLDKAASGNNVSFAGSTGKVVIEQLGAIASTFDIVKINSGDQILLPNAPAGFTQSYNSNTGTLTISNAGTTLGHLVFTPSPSINSAFLQNAVVKCFAAGTRIETAAGPIAVEDLRVGDDLVTADRRREPIVWIGQREVNCAEHPMPDTVWPVRVSAGAFGENVPVQDLYLSPDHAVFVNGVLVPVKLLVDGAGIVQLKRDKVMYFHVELAHHDVILAEGLTVESYLEIGNRANFMESGEPIRLFPDFEAASTPNTAVLWEALGAAPLVTSGEQLEIARRSVRDTGVRRHRRQAAR